MRIAKIHEVRLDKIEDSEEIELDLSPCDYFDNLDIFEDDKEFKKFIIHLKYYIRNSYEYKTLMKFLKEHRGLDCCGVHQNVKIIDGFNINIHHSPFTMEDIVYIVVKKRKETGEDLKMSSIASEVMQLHYMKAVGLYPLCQTCHEYAHSEANDLFIPLEKLFGNPDIFVDLYDPWLKDTPLSIKYDNIKLLNKGYEIMESAVPIGLRKKFIYVKLKNSDTKSEQYIISNQKLFDVMRTGEFMNLI